MRKALLGLGLALVSSSCWAAGTAVESLEPPQLVKLRKIRTVGSQEWGEDKYFRLKWEWMAEDTYAGVDVDPAHRQIWAASTENPSAPGFKLTVMDAHGESLRELSLPASLKEFRLLDAGDKEPRVVVSDGFRLQCFDGQGQPLWGYPPEGEASSIGDFTTVSKAQGGPLVATVHNYGDAGMRGLNGAGKQVWQVVELPRVHWAEPARAQGKNRLAATDGLGKVFVLDLKGKVLERITGEGNSDRAILDGADPQDMRLYVLDSGFDSRRQRIIVYRPAESPKSEAMRWVEDAAQDLGYITVSAFTLGDFDGLGRRSVVLGTDNGWVLVVDRTGRIISESRLRGSISFLKAADLTGDSRDELVVGVTGSVGNVFIFAR